MPILKSSSLDENSKIFTDLNINSSRNIMMNNSMNATPNETNFSLFKFYPMNTHKYTKMNENSSSGISVKSPTTKHSSASTPLRAKNKFDNLNETSVSEKIKMVHNVGFGKVMKSKHNNNNTNLEKKCKKIANYGILQSFNLTEKEKYKKLLESMQKGTPKYPIQGYSYQNLIKTTPTEVLDDNLTASKIKSPTISNKGESLHPKISSSYTRRINVSQNLDLQDTSLNNSQSDLILIEEIPARIQAERERQILNESQNETKNETLFKSGIMASRLIAPTRKIARQMSDYEKNLNERLQSKHAVIGSIFEKCKEIQLKANNLKEDEKRYKMIKRQRMEEELKLAKQFSERLQLNVNNLSKFYLEDIQEVIENEFPDFTDEQLRLINGYLISHAQDDLVVDNFNIQIYRKDLVTLKGLNWLNDNIINFYMNLICDRSLKKTDFQMKCYAFSTFFYPKLIKDGYSTILKRWTRKIDIFSYDLILVPIHISLHWTLAIIDFNCKEIRYYDSMNGYNNECLKALKNYLRDEHQDKKQASLDMSEWNVLHVQDIPQQMNGSDCGMFACKFAEYLSRGKTTFSFNQSHMPYFRKRMVWEIVNKQLM